MMPQQIGVGISGGEESLCQQWRFSYDTTALAFRRGHFLSYILDCDQIAASFQCKLGTCETGELYVNCLHSLNL